MSDTCIAVRCITFCYNNELPAKKAVEIYEEIAECLESFDMTPSEMIKGTLRSMLDQNEGLYGGMSYVQIREYIAQLGSLNDS